MPTKKQPNKKSKNATIASLIGRQFYRVKKQVHKLDSTRGKLQERIIRRTKKPVLEILKILEKQGLNVPIGAELEIFLFGNSTEVELARNTILDQILIADKVKRRELIDPNGTKAIAKTPLVLFIERKLDEMESGIIKDRERFGEVEARFRSVSEYHLKKLYPFLNKSKLFSNRRKLNIFLHEGEPSIKALNKIKKHIIENIRRKLPKPKD